MTGRDPNLGGRHLVEVLHQATEVAVDLVDRQAQVNATFGDAGTKGFESFCIEFDSKILSGAPLPRRKKRVGAVQPDRCGVVDHLADHHATSLTVGGELALDHRDRAIPADHTDIDESTGSGQLDGRQRCSINPRNLGWIGRQNLL